MLIFLVVNAALFSALYYVAIILCRGVRWDIKLIYAFVWMYGVIVIVTIVLGAVGVLYDLVLIGGAFLCVGFLVLITYLNTGGHPLIAHILPQRERRRCSDIDLSALWTTIFVGLAVLVLIFASFRAAVLPSSAFDAIMYHLPMAAFMRSNHSLARVGIPLIDGYPKYAEVFFNWIWAFFGDDRWVDLGQLPFVVLAMVSVFSICRTFGVGDRTALVAASIFPFTPKIIQQMTTNETDIIQSSLILAAVAILFGKSSRRCKQITFGLTLGLLSGVRFSGVVQAAVLWLSYSTFLSVIRKRRAVMITSSLVVLLTAILVGGYTYVKNAWVFGNPFYPFHMRLLGVMELPGNFSKDMMVVFNTVDDLPYIYKILRSWGDISNGEGWVLGGGGAMWVFLLVCVPLSLRFAIKMRERRLLIMFGAGLLLFFVTPANWTIRYVLFLVGFGSVGLGYVIWHLSKQKWYRYTLLVAALACIFQTVLISDPISQLYIMFSKNQDALAYRCDPCHSTIKPSGFRGAFRWIDENVKDSQTVLVCYGFGPFYATYCFWNRHIRNRVAFTQPTSWEEISSAAHKEDADYVFFVEGTAGLGAVPKPSEHLVEVYVEGRVHILRVS